MGCFDVLNIGCPVCNKITDFRSKAGDCMLKTFTIADAPLLIIADIHDDGKRGILHCDHCKTPLELEVQFIVRVIRRDTKAPEPDWRTE